MNVMKFFYLFILILFLNKDVAFAQFLNGDIKNILVDSRITLQMYHNNSPIDLTKTKGSPYLNNNFVLSKVQNTNINQSFEAGLRYNIYNDEIEFIDPKDKMIKVVYKKTTLKYTIANEKFVYIKDIKFKESLHGYYKIVNLNDHVSLFLKYTCKYLKEKNATPPLQVGTPAQFVHNKTYFIKYNDTLLEVPLRQKRFLNIFPNKKEISDYIKANSLNLKSERDLFRVITYINSLIDT